MAQLIANEKKYEESMKIGNGRIISSTAHIKEKDNGNSKGNNNNLQSDSQTSGDKIKVGGYIDTERQKQID